ncbi:hypothetical protein RHGRI_029066 [Rhododendron griersonianum]|uniref:Uncharacterized protein n=1 Tax=Rhododendron griersonianum TaxID=479676 RepID=A0AAV6ILP4_9ERIC|nr:hypothetical protein RHGRI_029066 [Rhododendron griersonianum]
MQLEGRLHVLWYVRGCQQLDVSLYTCTSRDETDVEVFACDLAAKLEETPAQVEPVVKVEKEKMAKSRSNSGCSRAGCIESPSGTETRLDGSL